MDRDPKEVNCLGYAYFCLGLQEDEYYLWPDSFNEIANVFEEANFSEAEAIIVTRVESNRIRFLHMAVFDRTDRNFVFHRPGFRARVVHESLTDLFEYFPDNNCEYTLLKRRQEN